MINKWKSKKVKVPNAFLFFVICFFAKIYYRFVYKLSVKKSGMQDIKPPFLVVAGHSCWLDHLITAVSMYPVRMNYVAAYNFFRDRILKTVFNFMGIISKFQFSNDIESIKKMKTVIDRGGVVAIFPNGCLSNEGRPGGYAVFGIAKLAKFLNVPVVAIRTNGGYHTRPRWTKRARYGRMETEVFPILTIEDLHHLSENEIYLKITESTYFDDYRWQRENMVPFRGKKKAEGLEYVLYKCPRCKTEFEMNSEGNRFFCASCGNAVKMNKYLFFEAENENSVFFDGIDHWFDYQKECIEREIENPDFELTAQTELLCAEPGKYGYQHLGNGTVKLTRENIIYNGLILGETNTIIFPMKNIPMVPYAAGVYIEIARGSDISRFVFEDLRRQIKWVMAIRQIRDRYYENGIKSEQKGLELMK